MKNIVYNALICNFILVFILGIIISIGEGSPIGFAFALFYFSFAAIVPIFILSVLQHFLKKRIRTEKVFIRFILQILALFVFAQIGLVVWCIFDIILYYWDFSHLSFSEIKRFYMKDYTSYQSLLFIIVFLLPIIDYIRNRKHNSLLIRR